MILADSTISRKINALTIVTVTLAFILFGVYETFRTRRILERELAQLVEEVSKRLAHSLSDPLWNFYYSVGEKLIIAEMRNESVRAIIVSGSRTDQGAPPPIFLAAVRERGPRDADSSPLSLSGQSEPDGDQPLLSQHIRVFNALSSRDQNVGGERISLSGSMLRELRAVIEDQELLSDETPIYREGQTLGLLRVYLTREHLMERIIRNLILTFLELVIIVLLVVFILALSINNYFSGPIRDLTRQSVTISRGDLEQDIPHIGRRDEIGRLATSFLKMRESVKEKITALNLEIRTRKAVEESLRVSEKKYMDLFESIADPVLLFDVESDSIVGFNQAAISTYGWSSDELMNMRIECLHFPGSRPWKTEVDETLRRFSGEYTHVDKEGGRIEVEINSNRIAYEGRETYISIVRDITQKNRDALELKNHRDHLEELVKERTRDLEVEIEEHLETERSLLRITQAIEEASDAIGLSDSTGSHFYQNRTFTRIFEYEPGELKNPIACYQDPAIGKQVMDTTMRGEQWTGETQMLSRHGRRFPALLRANAVKDSAGKIIGLIGIYTDITEQKKAEMELAQTQKKLVEAAHCAGMADIANGTLHNVGNLLNSVKTSAQVMKGVLDSFSVDKLLKANELLVSKADNPQEFFATDPRGQTLIEYYVKIEESLVDQTRFLDSNMTRLLSIIDAIVEVVVAQQSYAGTIPLTEWARLEEIIESVLMMQEAMIKESGITVKKTFRAHVNVSVQRNKLIHVLINLIANARDAMLSNVELPENILEISTSIEKGVPIIQVRDNGIGIDSDHLIKIFNFGFTLKEGGHGFGLHSCANYMSEMKGSIEARSDGHSKGSTFTLRFHSTGRY